MIGYAFVAKLRDAGLEATRFGEFGDYVATAGPNWVVYAAARGAESGVYTVALQVRARAKDARTAEKACRQAGSVVIACRYSPLTYTDPETDAETEFSVEFISEDTQPTWYPTSTPGEEASANYTVFVRESP